MSHPIPQALTPLALVLLLSVGACAAPATDPADAATHGPDARAATAAQTVAGGRDPPANSAPGGNLAAGSEDGANEWTPNAVVERIVDGDTLVAKVGKRSETVRLIGIDTPETMAPTRPVQCFGREASLYLEALLPAGTEITLVRDAEARDTYDRMLGYAVRSHDGLFVNLELVATGHAAVLNYPPNDHYAEVFARVEAEAVTAGRGLWSACGGPDVPLD